MTFGFVYTAGTYLYNSSGGHVQ